MGTVEKVKRRVVELVCVFLLSMVVSALAQTITEQNALLRAQKFADQVVRVIPKRIDGTTAPAGFGLLVGELDGFVYIATPYHVAFGRDQDRRSSLSATPSVAFHSDRFKMIQARRLDVASPRDDLAVLQVALPQGLAPPRAPMVLAAQLPLGTWVWNIGIGQEWDMPDRAGGLGPQDAVTGLRRTSGLRTPPGASGGAVVTYSGVIGIVLVDGTDISFLLPVERIVQLFTAWGFPVNLLTSQPGVDPAAELWQHNGSILKLVTDPEAQHQRLIFVEPRTDLRRLGVIPGMVQFAGTRDGSTYSGQGTAFSRLCGGIQFRMSGKLVNDRLIILKGLQPRVNPDTCARAAPTEVEYRFEKISP
jgi:hypothetical protein